MRSTDRLAALVAAPHDVVVIGAGIVGLGHALAARRAGASVLVIERQQSITGASVRNFGHLCFTAQSEQGKAYALRARPIWLELIRAGAVELRSRGTWVVARSEAEMELLRDAARRMNGAADSFAAIGAGERSDVELKDADEVRSALPVAPDLVVGGAVLPYDLQVNPRSGAPGVAAALAEQGVDFAFGVQAGAVLPGAVLTSVGEARARHVFVCTNHEVGQLLPAVAEHDAIRRCHLDMLRLELPLRSPLPGPVFTGWSMLRYAAFAGPHAERVRSELHAAHPGMAALDINQMYTQHVDGSVIVGDTHRRSGERLPFQPEAAFDELVGAAEQFFGVVASGVVERWEGVYATAPQEFSVRDVAPGVHASTVTTGIGMTTGLGLGSSVVARALGLEETEREAEA